MAMGMPASNTVTHIESNIGPEIECEIIYVF